MSNDKEQNLREEIVAMASTLFTQYGIRSISIDEICKRLSISKKTFYVYFEQKVDLVDAVLKVQDEEMEVKAMQWLERQTTGDTLRNAIAQMRKAGRKIETPPMMYDLEKYYYVIFRRHKQRFEQSYYNIMVRYLQKGKDEGVFRADLDVDICAEALTKITLSIHDDKQFLKDSHNIKMVRFIADTIMRGLVSEEGMRVIVDTK